MEEPKWTLWKLFINQGNAITIINPLPVSIAAILAALDVSDRWNRQLGQIDLARVLGAPLAANNPVISGIYDALGNRMPAMDVAARPGYIDVIDRANRLLGIVYGNLAQLQQVPGTFELITQDTGLNTNPERWLQDNHWEADEVTIVAGGVGGEQNLGVVVPAGVTRRIRELTIRNPRNDNVVITLLISGGATKVTIDVTANSTKQWSSQDGREFDPTEQPAVQSSVAAVAPNCVYVSASGVQA